MRFPPFLLLLATLFVGLSHPLRAELTVEVVNDSALPDSEVYALLLGTSFVPGGSVVVSGIPLAYVGVNNSPAVQSVAISAMTPSGKTLVSKFTGRTLPVYQFTVGSVASGVLLVSYGKPISYTDSNPSPITSNFRFDQLEMSFDPNQSSIANLTSIDAYSIPLQMELFPSPQAPAPSGGLRTYYASTASLISEFGALGAAGAVYGINTNAGGAPVTWNPKSGLGSFARILGPGKISSTTTNGNPAPFPSFGQYLASLAGVSGGGYAFTISGNANGSTYDYSGKLVGDGSGGYLVNLSGTTDPAPPSPIPANAAVVVHLPNGSAPGSQPTVNYDSFIYGAVLNSQSFTVNGVGSTNSNTVYGAIARDVLSGINFGYLNGRYGNSGANWYGVPPTEFPFGRARNTNDGFYNPWAAIIYNRSDAYGFAFSDRSGPSPALTLQDTDTLRVTVLPDVRLDSPRVAVTNVTDTTLGLTWPAVAGATGYQAEILLPGPVKSFEIPAATGSVNYTLTGLQPGTPYTFIVRAIGSTNGVALQSPAQRQYQITAGTLQPVNIPTSNPERVSFLLSFSWTSDVPEGSTVEMNGVVLTYYPSNGQWFQNSQGGYAQVSGVIGTNYYVVRLKDGQGNTLFANDITAVLTGTPAAYDVQLALLGGNLRALARQGDPATPPYTPTLGLTLSVPFVPLPTKELDRVVFPSETYAQWLERYPGLANSEPGGNPDRDSRVNLMEYFQGSDPGEPDSEGLIAPGADAESFWLRYEKSTRSVGIEDRVEWTTDLIRWTTEGVFYQSELGEWGVIQRTGRIALEGRPTLYLRLVLTPE